MRLLKISHDEIDDWLQTSVRRVLDLFAQETIFGEIRVGEVKLHLISQFGSSFFFLGLDPILFLTCGSRFERIGLRIGHFLNDLWRISVFKARFLKCLKKNSFLLKIKSRVWKLFSE